MVRLSKSPRVADSSFRVMPLVPASARQSIICRWRDMLVLRPV